MKRWFRALGRKLLGGVIEDVAGPRPGNKWGEAATIARAMQFKDPKDHYEQGYNDGCLSIADRFYLLSRTPVAATSPDALKPGELVSSTLGSPRHCKGCHPYIEHCPACDDAGIIWGAPDAITSAELIQIGKHPGVQAAIGTKSRFA